MTIITNLELILCYSDELERPTHLMDEEDASVLVEDILAQLDFQDDDSTIDTCFDCDSTISDRSSLLGSIDDEEIYFDDERFDEDSLAFARRDRRELRNQSSSRTAEDIFSLQDSLVLSRRSNQTTSRRFNGEESYIFDDDSLIHSRNRLRSSPLVRSSGNTDIDSTSTMVVVVVAAEETSGEWFEELINDDSEETVWRFPKQQLLERRRPNNRRRPNMRTHQHRSAPQP
jgi:hypothetical protein